VINLKNTMKFTVLSYFYNGYSGNFFMKIV